MNEILATDKVAHFGVGALIVLLLTHNPVYKVPPWVSLVSGVAAGIGKEAWDARSGGTGFDGRDLAATAAGAGTAYLVIRGEF